MEEDIAHEKHGDCHRAQLRLCWMAYSIHQAPPPEQEKALDKVKEPPRRLPEPGTGGAVSQKKRRRPIHLHVMVSEEELALIRERMAEAGVRNLGAYVRKMALNGYVLHVDLSAVRELVSLQRRCSNNLNQVAIQANTYGGIYPEEIKALQRDYETLWRPLSDLLKKLSAMVRALTLPGSGFAVPRLSRLLDTLSRGGGSRSHPCWPPPTEL